MATNPYQAPETLTETRSSTLLQFFGDPVYRFLTTASFFVVISVVASSGGSSTIVSSARRYQSSKSGYGIPPSVYFEEESNTDLNGSDRRVTHKSFSVEWTNFFFNLMWVAVASAVLTWFFHPLFKLQDSEESPSYNS